MNEMTLLSRHRIQNSSPGDLSPNTPPFGQVTEAPHNTKSSRVSVFLKLEGQSGVRIRDLRLSNQAGFNPCTSAPAILHMMHNTLNKLMVAL